MNRIASMPVRKRSTIGGNIINSSPIGDMTVFFLALDAVLALKSNGKTREILLKDFYLGYKHPDMKENEILEWISFPIPAGDIESSFNFEKVSRRKHLEKSFMTKACFFM